MNISIGKAENEFGVSVGSFESPLGNIRIESDDGYITAVYFDDEKIDGHGKAIDKAKAWLGNTSSAITPRWTSGCY